MKIANISVFGLILFLCSPVFGTIPFETPIQPLKQGRFSTGLEYVHAKVDVEAESASLGPFTLPKTKIKDIELDRVFFVPSYALFDFLTISGRIGANRLDIDSGANRDNFGGQLGTSNWDFTAGGSIRAVLYHKERFSWLAGGIFTYTDLDGFDNVTAVFNGIPVNATMKLHLYDYQFITGPAYEFVDGWLLSAGPYFQFIDGNAKLKASADGQQMKTTIDIDEIDYFGGYVSSQLQLSQEFSWNVRFSATGSGYTIATGITRAF
jgi:hypothetical protein